MKLPSLLEVSLSSTLWVCSVLVHLLRPPLCPALQAPAPQALAVG